jgi:hypothetical protein
VAIEVGGRDDHGDPGGVVGVGVAVDGLEVGAELGVPREDQVVHAVLNVLGAAVDPSGPTGELVPDRQDRPGGLPDLGRAPGGGEGCEALDGLFAVVSADVQVPGPQRAEEHVAPEVGDAVGGRRAVLGGPARRPRVEPVLVARDVRADAEDDPVVRIFSGQDLELEFLERSHRFLR